MTKKAITDTRGSGLEYRPILLQQTLGKHTMRSDKRGYLFKDCKTHGINQENHKEILNERSGAD